MATAVFVGNLHFSTTEEDLRAFVGQHGTVLRVNLPRERGTHRPRGFAFVDFATPEEAERAVEHCHGRELKGRTVNVEVGKPRRQPPSQHARRSRR